jgi:hypothetical protein
MKFWMFHLMPWPHLPDDFEEKYDTAWVTCPNTLFDSARGPEVYHGYINQLAYADELGFDGVVINRSLCGEVRINSLRQRLPMCSKPESHKLRLR